MTENNTMNEEKKIDYIEFPARDLEKAKAFYTALFGWKFEDYGPEYCSFDDGRITGGFRRAELAADASAGSVLVVFYTRDLEALESRAVELGATISTETFSFPGGRRFHFKDPNGNELAVWSDK